MTNALMVIMALAQYVGRIQLVWVWVLLWSWRIALLAFAMTGSPARRICAALAETVTLGGMVAAQEGYSMNATAVHELTVSQCAAKALRPKDAWIMAVIALLIVKKLMADATNAVLLAGNTCLAPPTTVAELVLLYPFPVAWASP
jgi:hypothetical protein